MFAGAFQAEPLPFEVTEVSVISGAEFEALISSDVAPAPSVEVALPQTVAPEEAPTPVPQADDVPEQQTPEASAPPEPESVPEVPQPLPAPPTDTAVIIDPTPAPAPEPEAAPETST